MTGKPTENNGEDKRRDRHDIVAQILETSREGRIKTHIMYKAKLSYAQTNSYLQLLLDKGFLERSTIKKNGQEKEIYTTTPKGKEFYERVVHVNTLLQ